MKNLRLFSFAVFFGCFIPVLSYAQGARFDSVAQTTKSINAQTVGAPISVPVITVCTAGATGIPCSPQILTYTDATLTTSCAGSTQVTLPNSSLCQSTGDILGNFGFWVPPGNYKYSVSAPGVSGQLYNVTVPCTTTSCGSINSICQVTASQTLGACIAAVTAPATIEVTPSAGTQTISVNTTVPSGITLRIDQGATLSIANTVTLTINGPLQAPNATVFAYVGSGIVALADGQGMVNANWFPGADMGAQINNAYAALPGGNHGGSIFVPEGAYSFATPIVLNSTSKPVSLKGAGTNNTFLVYTASSGTALTLDTGVGTGNSVLEDFTLLTFVSAATTTGLSVGPTNLCNFCKFNRLVIQNFQTIVTNNAFGTQFDSVNLGPCSSAASTVAFVQAGSADDTQMVNNTITACATLINNNASTGPIWITNVQLTNATTVFINANAANVMCSSCHLFNQAAGSPTNWFTSSASIYFSNTFFEDAKSSGTQASCGSMTSGTLGLSNVTITNEGGETCTLFVALSSTAALSGNGITNTNTTLVPTLYTTAWPKATVFGYHTSTLDNAVTVVNPLIMNAAPTILAAGCGGSAATIPNNNGTAAFEVNVGTTPGSACTITMPAAAHGWACSAVDVTTNSTSVFYQKQSPAASQTTTQIVITNFSDVAAATAFTGSDVMRVFCNGY